jgi:hypothetical protein
MFGGVRLDMDLTFVGCEFIPLKGYQDSIQILSGFASGIIAFVLPSILLLVSIISLETKSGVDSDSLNLSRSRRTRKLVLAHHAKLAKS